MSAPQKHSVVTGAPIPGALKDINYLYKFLYELWIRTGGEKSTTGDLNGLESSVGELNTLVGIRIDETVQQQLDLKTNSSDLGTMSLQDADDVAITGGAASNVSIDSASFHNGSITGSTIKIPVNTTSLSLQLGATLTSSTTDVGNVGSGEDTLISYVIPANTLGDDLQYLEVFAWGSVAANANNKTIKLKIGSTTLFDTGAVAANDGSWMIDARIIRTGAGSMQSITRCISSNSLIVNSANYVIVSEDTASSLTLSCTGEGTSNADIIQHGQIIKWFKT